MQGKNQTLASIFSKAATMMVGACATLVPAVASAQDAEVEERIRALSSPLAHEREEAGRFLVDFEGNIGASLRLAYDDAAESQRVELLDIARRRNDAALALQAAQALVAEDVQMRTTAREYLFVLERPKVAIERLKPAQYAAWCRFKEYARHRRVAAELIESLLKPGRSIAQFEKLKDAEPAHFELDLMAVLNLEEAIAAPLADAASASQAREAGTELRRNLNWRRLASCHSIPAVVPWLREGKADDALRRRLKHFTEGSLVSAISLLQDLRASAARALAVSRHHIVLPEVMLQTYRTLESEPADPYLKRIVDSSRVMVEIEIALSRFGRPEMLDERISAMRKQVSRAQTGEAAVPSRMVTDTELRIRNDIAYLLLRNGTLAEAESEWKQIIADVKAAAPIANSRQRGTMAAMLGGIYYNLACVQGLQLKAESGLESLRRSVEAGYGDFEWMLEDSDLDHVRAVPAFRQWFEDSAPPSVVDRLPRR